jgi:hypothetical protein
MMATARETWRCTDPRDSRKDRWTFYVYPPAEVADVKRGHTCVLYLLGVPHGDLEGALVVERVVTDDARGTARTLLAALARSGELDGHDGRPDPDRARNLRNRLVLFRRDHGDLELRVAVHYGPVIPVRKTPDARRPTEAMTALVIDRVAHEGYGGYRWHVARRADQLPAAPHARTQLALVGVDHAGRINGSLPRPNHYELDLHGGTNLRAFVGAISAHPSFTDTVRWSDQRGLQLVFLWRWANDQRTAA